MSKPKPPPVPEEKRDYWEERAEQNAQKVFDYSQRKAQLVTRWFGRAAREMDKRIVDFYRSYADKEQITLPKAKAVMTDRRALALTVTEAARLAQLHPDDPVTQQLLQKAYTSRAISREEFLQMQLNLLASELYGDYSDTLHRSLTEVFEESYYKGLFDCQQFVGFGSSFNRISTHQIEAAVTTAWKGKNYSERLWGDHRKSLARYLNRIVTNGFIQGSSGGQMRAELQKAMSMSAYEARRLIRTESCQVSNRASLLGYQEFGTEQFQFLATLDFKTSELCRGMDGKVFPVSEASPGDNMPPLHPFCRSTTAPYFPEDAEDTRVARGADGVTYTVPADMTYREWHQQYVESDPAQALAEQKLKHGQTDAKQYSRYQNTLGKDAPKTFDDFQNLKYTDTIKKQFMALDYRRRTQLRSHPERALPMANMATAADEKFTGYLFNPNNAVGYPKGLAISSRLGYNNGNWQLLQREVLEKADQYPVKKVLLDTHGQRYEQKIVLYGLKETPANAIVGWIEQDGTMKMTTLYLKEVR